MKKGILSNQDGMPYFALFIKNGWCSLNDASSSLAIPSLLVIQFLLDDHHPPTSIETPKGQLK